MGNTRVSQGIKNLVTFPARGKNSFFPKKGQMLGEVGLRHTQSPGQIIHAPLSVHQLQQKLKTNRMPQDLKASSSPHHLLLVELLFNIHEIRILKY